jgi:hypothetical protein
MGFGLLVVIASLIAFSSPSEAADAARGDTLYHNTYRCNTCHADQPDAHTNIVVNGGTSAAGILSAIDDVSDMTRRFSLTLAQRPTDLADIAAYLAQFGGPPSTSAFDLNRRGLTGSWFNAATSGQGVELEIYPDLVAPGTGLLQGAWFTYDYMVPGGASSQRWYTFGGNVQAGQGSATLTLYENTGGNFNALPVTSATPVGSVVFSATDCNHASMSYTFTDGSGRAGSIAMTRLLPNVTCTSSPPETASADFAYSGNWYDRTTSGQGIIVELNPNQPLVWLTWYTYAPNGQAAGAAGQRWYTAQAAYTPGSRSLVVTLYETTGGSFDHAAPTPSTTAVGTATITLTSCSALKLDFNFTGGSSAGASGSINMTRVGPVPAACGA